MVNFRSDNEAPVAPEIMAAITSVNQGTAHSYGEDATTVELTQKFSALFERDVIVFPLMTGTAANALALGHVTPPFGSIFCAEQSHVLVDECGAAGFYAGGALMRPLPSVNGKIEVRDLVEVLGSFGAHGDHEAKPSALTIAQATECGTLYKEEELLSIAEVAKKYGIVLHMDGARLANAAAFLELPPRAFTVDAGVDLLSLGLTKTGAMMAEAVVMFGEEASRSFPYVRKQGLQLASKMRFISAQFLAMLTDDLWLQLASHANEMAQRLRVSVQDIPGVELVHPTQGNGVFVRLAPDRMRKLLAEVTFAVWDPQKGEARWMTAWDTTAADVDAFAETVRQIMTPR